uniref:Uncharacterized protein n=1 Tax=Arundo donax TaxID=35708 RepID=A0A0A9A408_ARUDO
MATSAPLQPPPPPRRSHRPRSRRCCRPRPPC